MMYTRIDYAASCLSVLGKGRTGKKTKLIQNDTMIRQRNSVLDSENGIKSAKCSLPNTGNYIKNVIEPTGEEEEELIANWRFTL